MSDGKDVPTVADHEEKYKRIRKFLIIGGIVTAVLFVIGYWTYTQMLGYVSYHRWQSLNDQAHRIYQNAEGWLDEGRTLTTHIARKSKSADPDSFTAYISCDDYGHWYGVVCNTQGELMYTLYSWKQIPEQYLAAPPERDEMLELLKKPFRNAYAVGTWIPEGNNY